MTGDSTDAAMGQRAGFLLSRVGTAVQAGFKEVLTGWGIRPLHYMVLGRIQDGLGSSQQELCRTLGIDSGNMVDLIDKLQELGYATRTRSSQDRRRQILAISESGRAALAEIAAEVAAFEDEFFGPLTRTEMIGLGTLLSRLYSTTPEAQGKGFIGAPPPTGEGDVIV